jgi:hypothetical protein
LRIFGTAKVFAEKKLVQGNNLRAARGGFADFAGRPRQIIFRVGRAFHLHETNGKFICHEKQFSMSEKNICVRFVLSFAQHL